jgi:hypothetical protein
MERKVFQMEQMNSDGDFSPVGGEFSPPKRQESTSMTPADLLATAVSNWLTAVLPRFTPDARKVWDNMLAGHCDVRVSVRLREGSLTIDAVDDVGGRYLELYREYVASLREPGTEPVRAAVQ